MLKILLCLCRPTIYSSSVNVTHYDHHIMISILQVPWIKEHVQKEKKTRKVQQRLPIPADIPHNGKLFGLTVWGTMTELA